MPVTGVRAGGGGEQRSHKGSRGGSVSLGEGLRRETNRYCGTTRATDLVREACCGGTECAGEQSPRPGCGEMVSGRRGSSRGEGAAPDLWDAWENRSAAQRPTSITAPPPLLTSHPSALFFLPVAGI